MASTKIETGINGFGRFGLHLLKYWLDRSKESNFTIDYILLTSCAPVRHHPA